MAARSRLERRRAARRFRRRRPERARRASGRRGDGPVAGCYDMSGLSATLGGAGAPWAAAAARRGLRPREPAGAVGGRAGLSRTLGRRRGAAAAEDGGTGPRPPAAAPR